MWTAFQGRLSIWPDITVLFGFNILFQTTLIILVGLVGAYILRIWGKGASVQSLLLRICMVGVFLAPAALLLSSAAGIRGVRLEMPLHGIRSISAPTPQTHSSASLPADQGERLHGKENSVRPLPAPETPSSPHTTTLTTAAQPPVKSEQSKARTAGDFTPRVSLPQPMENAERRASSRGISWRLTLLLSLAWGFLSLFFILRAVAITLYIRRIQNLSFPLLPHHLVVAKSAADELGISLPTILQSPYVSSALLTGVFRSVILIPFGGDENLMATREIFLHELAHMARRDPLWLHLCQFAKILFPFQPLLWMLARRIEELSDFACDDYVIHHTGGNRKYASMLLNIARSSQLSHIEAAAGAGIFSSRFSLVRRIQHILDNSYARHITVSANEAMSFTIIFLCAVTLSGFIGFRGEDTTGTAYASEHHSHQGGKTLLKKLSRLHLPLTAPLAAFTMENQQADASLSGKAAEPSPGHESAEPEREPFIQPGPAIPAAQSPETLPAPQTASVSQSGPGRPIEPGPEEKAPSIVAETASILTPSQTAPASGASDSTVSHPAETTEKHAKTAARDSLLNADWLEMRSAGTDHGELAAPPEGVVKIKAPENAGQTLRESLEQGQVNPVWSPNGKVIAFTDYAGKGIWAVSAKGGTATLIHDNTSPQTSGTDAPAEQAVRTLCFSPDGKELIYVKYTPDTTQSGANMRAARKTSVSQPVIESVNLITGERREIVNDAWDGCCSPDGRYFVYVGGNGYGIMALDTQTGKTRVVSSTGSSPSITPDCGSIIYMDLSGGVDDNLFRAPLEGGKTEMLTRDGRWLNPKRSPDGEWVLCTGYSTGGGPSLTYLRAFNLRESRAYEVYIFRTGTAEMGDWSPNGRQYCLSLSDNTPAEEKNTRKSAIYIGDFNIERIVHSAGEVSAQPAEFKLIGNFPNPFNSSTSIRFSIPEEGLVDLVIYSINGQKVKNLVSENLAPGKHTIQWDGRDQNGKPVSSGVYISQLKMKREVETRRMTLVK